MQDLYSPWVVVGAVALALATARALVWWQGGPSSAGRFVSVDGLRGFLAFFVFLHHSCIWFLDVREGGWPSPDSRLYVHLGDSSVALFFMITAFLFTSKMIDSRTRPVDWLRLYVSRLTRLFPLYAFAVVLLWLMAWALTGWTRHVSLGELGVEALDWLAFTIPEARGINGLGDASLLMAGVTWSLAYEWWFYLSLPVLGWCVGGRSAWGWSLFALVNILAFRAGWHLDWRSLVPFVGGVAAAFAVRSEVLCRWARHPAMGVVVVACLAAAVWATPTAFVPMASLLLSAAFVAIACGNDLFGVLSASASRMLGEMTYSIYLLHGLMLSFMFRWVVGRSVAARWTVAQHWGMVMALTVPLVLLSYATFRWIEVPAQKWTPALTAWLRRRMAR